MTTNSLSGTKRRYFLSLDPGIRARIVEDRMSGMLIREVADKYSVSERSVRRYTPGAVSRKPATVNKKPEEEPRVDSTPLYAGEAACKNELPELFEYDPSEWPDKTDGQWKQDLSYALDVCIECPVMILCGEAATKKERHWTVRGGQEPGRWLAEHGPIGVLH